MSEDPAGISATTSFIDSIVTDIICETGSKTTRDDSQKGGSAKNKMLIIFMIVSLASFVYDSPNVINTFMGYIAAAKINIKGLVDIDAGKPPPKAGYRNTGDGNEDFLSPADKSMQVRHFLYDADGDSGISMADYSPRQVFYCIYRRGFFICI